VIERGVEEVVLQREVDRALHRLRRVVVEPEDERRVDVDARVVDRADERVPLAEARAPFLAHLRQVRRVERLEADEHQAAAALLHRAQQLGVARHRERALTRPDDVQRLERAAQLEEVAATRDQVVVHEEEEALLRRDDVPDDVLDRARMVTRVVVARDVAELAGVRTAAAGLDQPDRQVGLAGEDAPVRHARSRGDPAVVAPLQPPVRRVLEQAAPHALRVPRDDGVRVLERLVGQMRRMIAAHDDLPAAAPELGGDRVRAARGVRLDGDRHEVGRRVVVDQLEPVVEQFALVRRRREPGEHGDRQGLHLPRADVAPSRLLADRRVDERDLLHAAVTSLAAGTSEWSDITAGPKCGSFFAYCR
jgi:hypothetical protein